MTGQPSRVARETRARERVAAVQLLFPELTAPNTLCRLCALVEDDPALLRRVHDLWNEGKGVRALETETRLAWAERDEVPLDHRCFDRHLRGHVTMTPSPSNGHTIPDVQAAVDAAQAELAVPISAANTTQNYLDMQMLIESLRGQLEAMGKNFKNETGKTDSYSLMLWLKLVDSFRQTVKAAHDMQRTEQLTRAILQITARRMAQCIAEPMAKTFRDVLAELRNDPEHGTELLEQFLRAEMGPLLLRSADDAVRESCETYKL